MALTYSRSKDRAEEIVDVIRTAGGCAEAIQADSAKDEDIAAAVDETVHILGSLDILVNNAGGATFAPVQDLPIDAIDTMININIRGVVVGIREALRHLPDGGRIVTIGSINADRMPFPGGSIYGMTKAAVAGLTRGLSRELGPRNITVNNVQPGPVDTEANPANGPMSTGMLSWMALDRFGRAEEIAAMVSYLAGPEAAFVTGASLDIDGGFGA